MKTFICNTFAWFLYRAMRVLYKRDERVKRELDSLAVNDAFALEFSPNGKCFVIEKTPNGLKRRKQISKGDNVITFKTISLALKVMTGQKGLTESYSQHDFSLKGSINKAMVFVRVVEIVMAHLLPRKMLVKILREVPKRKISLIKTYFLSVFGG